MAATGSQVIALYEYKATNEGDLSVFVDDIVTVLTPDQGDGWLEGECRGERGFFPAGYVTPYTLGSSSAGPADVASLASTLDTLDDDWDSDDGRAENYRSARTSVYDATAAAEAATWDASAFTMPANVSEANLVSSDGAWVATDAAFRVHVRDPEQKKKMAGLKKFTAYSIDTPARSWHVTRRYKHFVWLHERLERKFPSIAIPPLPAAQASGRFKADFIEERRLGLEYFLNACARHPILRAAPVVVHFLSVNNQDREAEWKAGKRQFEKDQLVGEPWFYTVRSDLALDPDARAERLELFAAELEKEAHLCADLERCADVSGAKMVDAGKHVHLLSTIYGSIATIDTASESGAAAFATLQTELAAQASRMQEHARAEELLLSLMHLHRTRIKLVQRAARVEQAARQRFLQLRGRSQVKDLSAEDATKLEQLREALTRKGASAVAEQNFFREQRLVDFKRTFKAYCEKQVAHYAALSASWANALQAVNTIAVDETKYDA